MESFATAGASVTMPDGVKPAWGGWGQVSHHNAKPLTNVMSEELAEQIILEESSHLHLGEKRRDHENAFLLRSSSMDDETKDDLRLAQKLQMDFDAEFARNLQCKTSQTVDDETSELTSNEWDANLANKDSECEDSDQDDEPRKDKTPQFNSRGTSGKGKNIVTKHDAVICNRRNAQRVMERFPADFETGDDHSFDMRLPNDVFNKLKAHSNMAENKRAQRLHEKKEHSTADLAVDANTRLILYKLVNSGVLNGINGVIASGKESVVFYAYGGSFPNEMGPKECAVPKECALKVFKTTLGDFKNRYQYVCGDTRFFKDEFKKQNPRRIMKIWAEKEAVNLRRMAKFGIPCPSTVLLKNHVLVMSFIGDNGAAAPKLQNAALSSDELQVAFEQCVQHMKTMYKCCQLVHADLSAYNILWHDNKVYFIDVAQAVDFLHPSALKFLFRDCQNISDFFTKRGVAGVPDAHDLFNDITELSLQGDALQDILNPIQQYEKNDHHIRLGQTRTDHPFNYFFEKSCTDRDIGLRIEGGAEEEGGSETDTSSEEEEVGEEGRSENVADDKST